MQQRRLGRTGLCVSPIGFGAFKIGRNQGIKYPKDYPLPSDSEVDRLLNGLLDAGINYIDTAPAYGVSEERIGRAIAHRREQFVLSTKVGETFENGTSVYDYSEPGVRSSIERSLRRLKTDLLDIVFIHSDGNDLRILDETPVVEILRELKTQGLIGAIGLSGKTVAGASQSLDWADVVMVEYHRDDRSHEKLIADAAARGVGVVVKKGLASGRLSPAEAIRFVLGNKDVGSLVIGGLNGAHIQANIALANNLTRA